MRSRLVSRLVFSCLGLGLFGATVLPLSPAFARQEAPPPLARVSVASQLEEAFTRLVEQVEPATVTVEAEMTESETPQTPRLPGLPNLPEDSPFGDLFPFRQMPPRGPRQTSGSGVIVRADGYILTNDHVVAGAKDNQVKITLQDGSSLRGRVFRDARSDLAVIKVESKEPLPAVRLADTGELKVGQWAIAIGSPFRQQNTVTVGIVSALHRKAEIGSGGERRYYPDLIQTDASINPGNSGGPLLNLKGEVIGINVAIYSPSGTNAGIGFAIPAATARYVMEQLIKNGKVIRGYLGMVPEDISPVLWKTLGTREGARVTTVVADQPAAKGGIRAGDIITRFGDLPIKNEVAMRSAIAQAVPNKSVPITLLRDGKSQQVTVTIGAEPEPSVAAQTPRPAPPVTDQLGLQIAPITPEQAAELNLGADVRGLLVRQVRPSSPAASAGLQAGDIVVRANGVAVATESALIRRVKELTTDEILSLVVLRPAGPGEKPNETIVDVVIP